MFGWFYETPVTLMISLIAAIIVIIAQARVSGAYAKYSKVRNSRNYTGFEVARSILDRNGLQNIDVVETGGKLSDHYDPTRKVVRLSSDIYHGRSIASVSVAAHEVGHALQDKEDYSFMRFRHALLMPVNAASKLGWIVIMLGFVFSMNLQLVYIGLFLLLGTVLFQLVTLPVEFNASKRALEQLYSSYIIDNEEGRSVKGMLNAAAFTYVAALASTILQLLRLLIIAQSRNND